MGRYFVPGLLLLISIGAFVAVTNPMYGEVKVLQEEQSAYSNALANSLQLQTVRDVLIEKQNQFSSRDIQKLEQMVPDSVDNIKLAIEIQKIGEAKGLSVESVQYDPSANQTNQTLGQETNANALFETFQLEIIARGEYEQFVSFLEELEKNLRIVDVVNVEFNSETSFLNDNTYTYNIIIKTYRLND